jgi:hypothetical protein
MPLSSRPARHPASGVAVPDERAATFHVNWIIVAIVVAVMVVAALVIDVMEVMRRRRLQQRFGPEYDRVAGERDSKLKAESELTARVRRVLGP